MKAWMEYDRRNELRNAYLRQARESVRGIEDREMEDILNLLHRLPLAFPTQEGLFVYRDGKSLKNREAGISIVPVTLEDVRVSDFWKSIALQNRAAGNFLIRLSTLVILTNQSMLPATNAITLLHEGYHAKFFAENSHDGQSDEEYCREEVGAYSFINRIVEKMGGDVYRMILREQIIRMEMIASFNDEDIPNVIPIRSEYNDLLSLIYGFPRSEHEMTALQTNVWIHAVFTIFEEYIEDKEKASERKAMFLCSLYKERRIL